MSSSLSPFHLQILGEPINKKIILTILAQFENNRVIERHKISAKHVNDLSKRLSNLHSFIDVYYPSFSHTDLKRLGKDLFDLVFCGSVKTLFDQATGKSQDLLPLEIFAESPEITGWPWEYIYDSHRKKFLCQEFHPITRGVFTLDATKPDIASKAKKLNFLLVVGTHPNDPESNSNDEIKWIKENFNTKLPSAVVNIEVFEPDSPKNLSDFIEQKKHYGTQYDVFHFYGHGAFDIRTNKGYLKFGRSNTKLYADELARMLAKHKSIRLVFLNACESGRTSATEQSSIAAELISRGIPAVIASQFVLPSSTAHHLSSVVYNSLFAGKSLIESVSDGRQNISIGNNSKFFDWGIPVLYSITPNLIIFPNPIQSDWIASYQAATRSENVVEALGTPTSQNIPSFTVLKTILPNQKNQARVRVALVDFDSKVGFLPDLMEEANRVQNFYNFQVSFLPLPFGAIRTVDFVDKNGKRTKTATPQLYLHPDDDYLKSTPQNLKVNKVCILTSHRVAVKDRKGKVRVDLRASTHPGNNNIFALSTWKLQIYANQSGVSYAKATLFVCLSMLVAPHKETSTNEKFHQETVGCLFDNCQNRDDITEGLKKMKFDHQDCRDKILDSAQIKAIDALLLLKA